MLAMAHKPLPGSRKELRRTPTAELPGLVDRILDARLSDGADSAEEPRKPGGSLLAKLKRLLEPGSPSAN